MCLKVPKCEIFDPFFITSINPIWVGDLRTGEEKNLFPVLRKAVYGWECCKYWLRPIPGIKEGGVWVGAVNTGRDLFPVLGKAMCGWECCKYWLEPIFPVLGKAVYGWECCKYWLGPIPGTKKGGVWVGVL